MGGPKMRRRGQQHDVARLDHVLVGVEAGESPLRRNLHARRRRAVLQHAVRRFDAIGKGVAHRHQVHVGVGGQRLLGRSASPTAAAHETDANDIAAAGKSPRTHRHRPEQRTANNGCSRLEKVTSRGGVRLLAREGFGVHAAGSKWGVGGTKS
jgi:hypothetical protein